MRVALPGGGVGEAGGENESQGMGQREGRRDRWETALESQKPRVRQMFIVYGVDKRIEG